MNAEGAVHHVAERGREIGLWVFVVCLLAGLGAAAIAFLVTSGATSEKWGFTALLLVAYGTGGAIAFGGLARAPQRVLSAGALGLLTVALAGWVFLVWLPPGLRREAWDAPLSTGATWVTLGGVVLLYRVTLELPRLDGASGRAARFGATLVGLATALAAGIAYTAQTYGRYDFAGAVAPAVRWGVLASLAGWVLVNVLATIEQHTRERQTDPTVARRVRTRVVCPRCESEVEVASNRQTRCPACRLRFRLVVEEPRCVCGYVLYRLEGDTCPECGRRVPEEDRWAAARAPNDPTPTEDRTP